jgi:hypothetical protein
LTGSIRLAATFALFLAISGPAAADTSTVANPGDAVPGHPGMTYLDLVRLAVPGLAMNADDKQIEGHVTATMRNLAGKEYENGAPDPAVLGFMQARPILVGGKPRLLIFADLGQPPDTVEGMALLMLFDDGPRPRLLDAADVSLDKDSEFADAPLLKLGPGDEAVVTYSEHDDADLTMGGYMIVSPVGDRLRMVDKVAITSEKLCSWTGIETPTFTTAPDPGRPYRRIVLTMKAVFTNTHEDGCNDEKHPKAGTLTFRAVYRWDVAKSGFVTERSDLKAFDKLNQLDF